MDEISVRRGEKANVQVKDSEGVTVKLQVFSAVNAPSPTIEKEATFVDGVANIELLGSDTDITPGDYLYQVLVYDENDEFEVYPSADDDCEGEECGFGDFIVCPTMGVGDVS